MATDILPADPTSDFAERDPIRRTPRAAQRTPFEQVLAPLASLRLTVVLFALAIFLVFAGTLAQTRYDIWTVMNVYFRNWVAVIHVQDLLPPAWFPSWQNVPGKFPFPGGFTIGTAMAINLLAAHGLRFKIQAKGARLWAGLGVIGFGVLLTWLVIVAGPDKDGSQATAPIAWRTLWNLFLLGLAGACVGIAASLFVMDSSRRTERTVLGIVGGLTATLLAYLLWKIDVETLDPAAMRILWQIIKAQFAAGVLFVGCVLVFRKRAGVVLLHAGIALLMANEVVVYGLHKESLLVVTEGEAVNYSSDIRTYEIAVIDSAADPKHDRMTVVPKQLVEQSFDAKKPISHADLPFDIEIVDLFVNAQIREAKDGEKRIADSGLGKNEMLQREKPVAGTDGEKSNYPAAYLRLLDKATGKPLGTYIGHAGLIEGEQVRVGDKTYQLAFRFQRDYKPYSLHLYEVSRENYPGTQTPRSYRSEFQIFDAERGVNRRDAIRMNEPLRYGGETFYQTGNPDDRTTIISIVSNFGWMIPYLSCVIVWTGLLGHFGLTLNRFLQRREKGQIVTGEAAGGWDFVSHHPPANMVAATETKSSNRRSAAERDSKFSSETSPQTAGGFVSALGTWLPIVVVVLCSAWLVKESRTPQPGGKQFDYYRFGQTPLQFGGRVMPVDTMARGLLRMISLREEYAEPIDGNQEKYTYQPAVKWFLDLITNRDAAEQYRIFRIDNPEVLNVLGLERRKYYRYSWAEIDKGRDRFMQALKPLEGSDPGSMSPGEKKLVELNSRLQLHELLRNTFLHRALPPLPSEEELKADPDKVAPILMEIKERLEIRPAFEQALNERQPPRAIPLTDAEMSGDNSNSPTWQPYALAWIDKYLAELRKTPINPATQAWEKIFDAYKAKDASVFNAAVASYHKSLAEQKRDDLSQADPAFEAWFNYARLFLNCQWLYFTAFCFAVLAWLGWRVPLNRTAFWLLILTFLVHTFAMCARMYISGRPPVTTLYSSALFIGWGGVLAGLMMEGIYRQGYGNLLSAISGFATLLIADKLSLSMDASRGDTIGVLQAVLDTQFWLATHVTTVTLGYTATFVAGLLGIIYVIRAVFTSDFTEIEAKNLVRMMYGTVCFGIFFSFVGTVLGGLWADDSWGRFWGWDPKENGALLIVLWNALILHARWDGLVKDRGLALLCIGGNIVTAWSWFGVNQLGVGLHSYGFTEGVLLALGGFVASQLLLVGLGLVPQRYWWSQRGAPKAEVIS